MKKNVKDYTLMELQGYMKDNKFPGFRAGQVYEWLYKDVESFHKMGNIPLEMRNYLEEEFTIQRAVILRKQASKLDGTIKYLLGYDEQSAVECVLMEYEHGNTICISTQVGCKMGCTFCASTLGGLIRNLTPGEMVEEVMAVERDSKKKVSNIVLMGCGEPFDNYDFVMKFLKIVNSDKGLRIGARHITLSTCGIIPMIERFAEEPMQVNLAISLHASNNEVRSVLMPVNHKYTLPELMVACRTYVEKTNRRITFEYALVSGENDSRENAIELAMLLKGMLCHVNIIPVNPVVERNYKKPDKTMTYQFMNTLKGLGIEATVRRELGSDIDAACGQLRNKY